MDESERKHKVCKKCNKLLPFSEFWKDIKIKDGKKSYCILCCKQSWNEKPGRPRTGRAYTEPLEKLCRGCNRTLPIDSFSIRTERKNGRRPRCKECANKAFGAWSEQNPGRSRKSNLKQKYGMTEQTYFATLASQNGKCGICEATESGRKDTPWLLVDHSHTTNKVRGLLCQPCNIAVGMIETNNIDLKSIEKWIKVL
jgi:hypothetical protein